MVDREGDRGGEVGMHADQFRAPDDADGDDGSEEDEHRGADEDYEDYDDEDGVRLIAANERKRVRAWNAMSTKTKLLGPTLFIIGAIMLSVYGALFVGAIDHAGGAAAERGTSTALLVLGSMCASAGGWSCLVMVQVWRREPGWSYSMIPGE